MGIFKSFENQLFQVNSVSFEEYAISLFRFQATENPVYAQYINHLGIDPQQVKHIENIPFLPISLFKTQVIKTGAWQSERVFESSGTTSANTAKHWVKSTETYLKNSHKIFERFYGKPNEYHFLALLPAYLERQNSSLVCMVQSLINKSNSPLSGFYLNEWEALYNNIQKALADTKKRTLLIGVSFALLDFVEKFGPMSFPALTVMETGGMKGRREEIIREVLHQQLKAGFGVSKIQSEYGMTELLSQAYALDNGRFEAPPWLKVMTRDVNDPFCIQQSQGRGGINIIDLANIHTCAFIETMDLGRTYPDGTFEVIGRFDNSDIRGCNLMVS